MKRIAFFQDNLDVGGIQKSIMNLLMNFDYENYQVDLYLSDAKSFWDVHFPEQLTVKYLKRVPRVCSFMPFDVARKLVSFDLIVDFASKRPPQEVADEITAALEKDYPNLLYHVNLDQDFAA